MAHAGERPLPLREDGDDERFAPAGSVAVHPPFAIIVTAPVTHHMPQPPTALPLITCRTLSWT
eukprot:176637-Pyramimonas_sp.AAC.1